MATPDFVQIHMLTSYPASLLNRDDVGLAKRIPFGGSVRTRVSSQCLKKHWREADAIVKLGPLAVRSREIYNKLVAEPLQAEHGASPELATLIAQYLVDLSLSSKDESKGGSDLRTGQVVVMTPAEIEFLVEIGTQVLGKAEESGEQPTKISELKDLLPMKLSDLKKNVEALPASLDTSLFGRFVTSDLFSRIDGAASVAHAFTTHAEQAETDYFTAIDTLTLDEPGAGLIQDTELTTGVFYIYAVVDLEQLRRNLVGHPAELAIVLTRTLVEVMATVSPGAKRGSTAPYSYAEFVLIERGDAQPRTLANAYLQPVQADGTQLAQASVTRLLEYRAKLDAMYGPDGTRSGIASIHSTLDGSDTMSLSDLLDHVLDA